MAEYLVEWVIGGIEADSPREAAEKALEIQRNPESTAVFFRVQGPDDPPGYIEIDLYEED